MKVFQPEARQCDGTDRDKVKNIFLKIAKILGTKPPPGSSTQQQMSDLKDALQDFGVLSVSFEGDKKQTGFFHRYDESCSIKITDLFQDIEPCLTSPSCGGSPKSGSLLSPAQGKQIEGVLSGVVPEVRFAQGSVRIDWVRVSLLAAVVVLALLLLYVLARGMV